MNVLAETADRTCGCKSCHAIHKAVCLLHNQQASKMDEARPRDLA
ncbi:hypothetical protein VDGL01_03978 [Verticillium dahliae]